MNRKKFNDYVKRYGFISMLEFISIYLEIDQHLDLLKELSHREIKCFHFDNLVCVSFDDVSDDNLATGVILFVKDKYNHIGAYLNPLRLRESNKGSRNFRKVR